MGSSQKNNFAAKQAGTDASPGLIKAAPAVHRCDPSGARPLSSSSPRTVARRSKIDLLTPRQRDALWLWLTKERVTYAEAKRRMSEQHGVSLSTGTIHKFWHRHCVKPVARRVTNVALDVVIKGRGPFRVIVKNKNQGVRVLKKAWH